jgi:hypothetical protein
MVYELPSVPVTVTWVAFDAVTVKAEEPPEEIDTGEAVMLTAGIGFELPVNLPPHPVGRRPSGMLAANETMKSAFLKTMRMLGVIELLFSVFV